jgi:hypothetical protein
VERLISVFAEASGAMERVIPLGFSVTGNAVWFRLDLAHANAKMEYVVSLPAFISVPGEMGDNKMVVCILVKFGWRCGCLIFEAMQSHREASVNHRSTYCLRCSTRCMVTIPNCD